MPRSHESLMGTKKHTPVPRSLTKFISWVSICVLLQHVVTAHKSVCAEAKQLWNTVCTGGDLKSLHAEKMTKLTPRHRQLVNTAEPKVIARLRLYRLGCVLYEIKKKKRGQIQTQKLDWLNSPCFLLIINALQCFCQSRNAISPLSPRFAMWPLPSWMCLEHLPKEMLRWHWYEMPEPHQLAPFYAKEQQLYSKASPIKASHPITNGDLSHTQTHAWHLFLILFFSVMTHPPWP